MLKFKPGMSKDGEGIVVEATPQSAPLHYVGAEVYHLRTEQQWRATVDSHHEQALILLTGRGTVSGDHLRSQTLIGRASVFEDSPPYVVYVSSGESLEFCAEAPCELLWASALLDQPSSIASQVYAPDAMPVEERGEDVTARRVRHLFEEPGQAERLRMVEVITPGGHWSSFPPHKHDREEAGVESFLEEIYYYHITPENLWAFQRIYDQADWGEALAVHDGELVIVPRGYHPVAAPPGCTVYYLNVMAGPTRDWNFTTDPAFAHVPGFVVPHPEKGASR